MERVRFGVHRTVGEARLLAGALEAAGISVQVRGEALAPLSGEIPSTETWVELWVWRHELEAARELVAELEENREAAGHEVQCLRCREQNPGNFELCWSCGMELPSAPRQRLRAVP
jgi:hypothetical protein